MFNYKQLALAIEMRTRYGTPNFTQSANGFDLDCGDLFPEARKRLMEIDKIRYSENPTVPLDELLLERDEIISKNTGITNDTCAISFFDVEGENGYSDATLEIWYDGCSVYQSYTLKLRNGYQAHEKMFTDLVVSQLQYWS